MQTTSLSRLTSQSLLTAALLGASALTAGAQGVASSAPKAADPIVPLTEFVISATRTPQDLRHLPAAVTLIAIDELQSLQIADLSAALDREPGTIVVNTGGKGGQSTVFLRGGSSHQTLFVVDGVRMSDRSANYGNFLGAAGLGGLDRIEILRGPQSTLYGSSAAGGVIMLETARASIGTTGSVAASGGSFDTRAGGISVRHGTERYGVTGALARYTTDNDRPGNSFENWSFAGRAEGRPTASLLVGATWRGEVSDYAEPGSRLFPSPGAVEFENHLATTYAEVKLSDALSSRVTAGLHRRDYGFTSQWGTSTSSNTRTILDLQNTWRVNPVTEIIFGGNYERSKFTVNTTPSRDELLAGYISAVVRPVENVTFTAGGRYDDYDSVGGADTWRLGGAWRVTDTTKLRATYGTAFVAPDSDDRFGVAQWGQLANPAINPEESRGWDVGIDQSLLNDSVRLSATWFRNSFRNLFEWETVNFTTFEGRIVNRARASTQGVEFAAAATLHPAVQTRIAYTYLDARNDTTDRRLIRRPRHTVDADVTFRAHRAVLLGLGAHAVADRVESFAPGEDYTTVRAHATWTAREDLRLRLRVENALNTKYEEVLGYPSLPFGVFGSVEWTF